MLNWNWIRTRKEIPLRKLQEKGMTESVYKMNNLIQPLELSTPHVTARKIWMSRLLTLHRDFKETVHVVQYIDTQKKIHGDMDFWFIWETLLTIVTRGTLTFEHFPINWFARIWNCLIWFRIAVLIFFFMRACFLT